MTTTNLQCKGITKSQFIVKPNKDCKIQACYNYTTLVKLSLPLFKVHTKHVAN